MLFLFLFGLIAALAAPSYAGSVDELRVCAAPNNLPFSNAREQGFENEMAQLVARDLGVRLRYVWRPQGRGFMVNALSSGVCDLVMSLPADSQGVTATSPYYGSSYVLVMRKNSGLELRSLDDRRLGRLRIGVHVMGNSYADVPPVRALARNGVVGNITSYPLYADSSGPRPQPDLIRAVQIGDIDVAVAWGPIAGYLAKDSIEPLEIVPIAADAETRDLDIAFDVAMGVGEQNEKLAGKLNTFIAEHGKEIRQILNSHGVPLQPLPQQTAFSLQR